MKVNVVGGGPAGSYSAYLLAKKGHDVEIYERNPAIGRPVQCTGILSDYFLNLMKPKKEFVENTVEKTRIYSPDGNYLEAKIKKNYVVCRVKLDNYLAGLAEEEGVKYHLGHSFDSLQDADYIKIKLRHKGKTIFRKSDALIGADGPLSPVAKSAGLFSDRQFVIGTQIEAKLKNDNAVEFYPHIGCYAWIVPKNEDVVRIGVASYKNAPAIFRKFAKEKLGKNYKTIENQSGVIPVFNPRVKAQKGNIFLNGDAATFVKATSGGGINQSLKGATVLASSISENMNYDKEWRKRMFRSLHAHLIMHKMMQRFTEKDWNGLVETFSGQRMKNILYSQSRDRIIEMSARIMLTKPSMIKYAKYFPLEEIKNII
jgi:digeranylgeranylglycerophospholipid reductase